MTQHLFIWLLFVLTLFGSIVSFVFAILKSDRRFFLITLIGFIATLFQLIMLLDYMNNVVIAPKFKSEHAGVMSSGSEKPYDIMPSASSFTKEVIKEHDKQLREFENQ